jgi:hypothetical protein
LIEDIKKRLSDRRVTEKDRQKLNQTLSTLKENTNNVVFVGKIRNEVKVKRD